MTLTFNNLDEVRNLFASSKYIFRGQERSWNIEPSLSRGNTKKSELFIHELTYYQRYLDEFEKRDILPRRVTRNGGNTSGLAGQWLALFRHYGIPSRLVDFTLNFHVALFFSTQMDDHEDGYIYAINIDELYGQLYSRYRDIMDSYCSNEEDKEACLFRMDRDFYEFIVQSTEKEFVIPMSPIVPNVRESAQNGVFIIYSDISRNLEAIMAGYPSCSIEITVDRNSKRVIRNYLCEKYNLTRYRLSNPVEWAIEDIRANAKIPF